jgi:transposase
MHRPEREEIPDSEHELVTERVAAIDVAKASGKVCVRTPGGRRRVSRVWDVSATTAPITDLADELVELGIEKLTVESTSDYWRIWYYLLEAAGLDVQLVNARDVKNVPGRPKDMIEALIAGERDPRRLAGLARGKMRPKYAALVEALNGQFDEHHAELARMLLDQIDALSVQIGTLTTRIEQVLAAMPEEQKPGGPAGTRTETDACGTGQGPVAGIGSAYPIDASADTVAECARLTTIERLDEIPGIGPQTAQAILAEIGFDMSRFPTAAHLVSWAKLCPRTIQSGAKQRSGKTGKGNPYLKGALGEAANAAAKTDTFLGERYRRIVRRRGKLKALVAVARSILVIIWHLLADPSARFRDLGSDYHTTRINVERKARSHIAQLTALGYHVTVQPAA